MKIIAVTQSGSRYELIPDRTGDVEKIFFARKEGAKSEEAIALANSVKHVENLIGEPLVMTNGAKSTPVTMIIIT
jgi:hypothetical protein